MIPRVIRARLVAYSALLGVIAFACRPATTTVRVVPGIAIGQFNELSESSLATLVICHDTLGRPDGPVRRAPVTRCTPCIPYGMQSGDDRALGHARRMWQQGARAPYDTLDLGANCTRLAYQYARARHPDSDSLVIEIALFQLADARDSVRVAALRTVDALLGERLAAGQRDLASAMLAQLGLGMWDRAQRQLERPVDLKDNRLEQRVHALASPPPRMTHVPRLPPPSGRLGGSEAEWASQLFGAAARLSDIAGERSRWMRLALAPWVVLEDWAALDSSARALLRLAPGDSAVWPAVALAGYRTIRHPVSESPHVMALFDTAMRAMPTADSLRYDSFDGVLSQRDDEWRYGFLPSDRQTLDSRGWAVLDPLWSTPVNEIRLARRARTAEADYRYADIARAGASGSQTRAGILLLRLGAPADQWEMAHQSLAGRRWLRRGWHTLEAVTEIDDDPDTWRVFYGTSFSTEHATTFITQQGTACSATADAAMTIYACALARRADWRGSPFYGTTDSIDVSVARFRSRGDSAEVYMSARMPLRAFKTRDDLDANATDRIVMSAWLTTAIGRPLFHAESSDPLPASGATAWFKQWTGRVGSQSTMHRVEGLEVTRGTGARGAAQFTSDAQVGFPLRGFGMSDVLIAAAAKPRGALASRWSDLDLQPNGGVVSPAQRFAVAWEVYDLTPGADGRVRWRVRMRRERGALVTRDDMKDVLSGSRAAGTKVLASETDAPDVSFVRDAVAAPVVLDYLMFSLGTAPVGRHVVQVTVDDLVRGTSVSRSVSVRVLVPDSQKRGTWRLDSGLRPRR